MPDHPSDADLRAYGLGRLDDAPAAMVAAHLDACPACRRRAAEASSDSFLGRLRDARAEPVGPGPAARPVAARSLSGVRADPPPADSLPPGLADLPDYTILRELGRGGMGVVYLAHNAIMGRDEVLKVMGAHIMERPGVFDRFQREIRAVARLHHRNIVTAYSAFRLGGGLVFAMEYVEGMDLARLIKVKGPLPVVHAAYFAQQAARGLQHAHERGTVHRDIKPHNLMLTHDGALRVVKILDFGLAKASREGHVDAALTQSGQALGTPDYIAPEQILNAPDVDVRADVYSLGCTLYFFLTGRAPFRGNSLYDLYQAHMSREADPLNRLRADVPSGLAALASKMIAKDPADRFQSPAEVAEALAPFLKAAAAGPRPAKAPPRPAAADPAVELTRDDRPAPTPPRPPGPTAAPAGPAAPEAMWTSLIDFRDTEAAGRSATPPPVMLPGRAAARGKLPPRAVAIGLGSLGALLALALLASQLLVRTPHGTIVLDGLPKDAVVTVDGAKVDVAWADGGPGRVSVAAGPHGLEVRRGRVKLYGDRVTVDAGEPFTVRLQRPAAAEAAAEGRPEAEPSKPDAVAAAAASEGFTSLFNRWDLGGWETRLSRPGDWRVEGGVLVGASPRPSYLYTSRGDYADFELHVEARAREGSNSLLLLRTTVDPGAERPTGYEVQVDGTGPSKTGTLHRPAATAAGAPSVAGTSEDAARPDEWFTMDVAVEGAHVVVKVDGRVTANYVDPSPLPAGHIALQVHDAATRVEFRRIEIQELGSAARPAPAATPSPIAGAIEFRGGRFRAFGERLSWHAARRRCEEMGGRLAIVGDRDLNERLLDLMAQEKLEEAWLGATDERKEGEWAWLDGSPLRFSAWADGQPTDRSTRGEPEHYLALWAGPRRWNDLPAHGERNGPPGFVCEWPAGGGASPAADGFTPLFNGRDLSGWRWHPSQPGRWTVVDGVLVGSAPGISHLYSERGDYRDFHLRLRARINDGGNSGVFFRATNAPTKPAGTPRWPDGYEAQINSTHADPARTGSLYMRGRAIDGVQGPPPKPGEWFDMEIIARGNHLVILVDGETRLDYIDAERYASSGHFSLQVHDAGTRVEFQKIEIKELPTGRPSAVAAPADGFRPLFNGRDTSGWKTHPGQPGDWRVENGVLVGTAPGASHLYTTRGDYGDFELRVQARINGGGNSGVLFRASDDPRPKWPQGYEAQIYAGEGPQTGGLYRGVGAPEVVLSRPATAPTGLTKPDEWFTMDVVVRGNHVVVKVNGQGAADYVDPEPFASRGHIALQVHGAQTRVEFRTIEIKELPPDVPPADARAFRGARYKLFPERLTWHQAEEECRKRGGRLAVVRDAAQDAFLHGLVREAGVEAAWLGATDERAEGRWTWADGSAMSYSNWAAQQPNNKGTGEHYLVLLDHDKQGVPFDGKWADQPDVSAQHTPGFLCEWPAAAR